MLNARPPTTPLPENSKSKTTTLNQILVFVLSQLTYMPCNKVCFVPWSHGPDDREQWRILCPRNPIFAKLSSHEVLWKLPPYLFRICCPDKKH
jgi:hypothetical protein